MRAIAPTSRSSPALEPDEDAADFVPNRRNQGTVQLLMLCCEQALDLAQTESRVRTVAGPTKVFVSYSHDSEHHKDRVAELSDRLCAEGVDCDIDQYEESPADGWPAWMLRQIDSSDHVLMVFTPTYGQRFLNGGDRSWGKGARFEGAIITLDLYHLAMANTKYIPVVLRSEDRASIPGILSGVTNYDASTEEGYLALYRRLTGQPLRVKPVIGAIRRLPTKNGGDLTVADFRSLCGRLRPLVDENRRTFRSFGPQSDRDARFVRWDLGLWERAREEVVVPNNDIIASLIEANWSVVPEVHRDALGRWKEHIFAFRLHCKEPWREYSGQLYPLEVDEIVEHESRRASEDEELSAVIEGLTAVLARADGVREAYLFGSSLYAGKPPADLDLLLVVDDESDSSIAGLVRPAIADALSVGAHLTCISKSNRTAIDEFILAVGYLVCVKRSS